MEEQKTKRAGLGNLTASERSSRFCRPQREDSKEEIPSWKFTGQAQWRIWVVRFRRPEYSLSERPSLGSCRMLERTVTCSGVVMLRCRSVIDF